ncbi:MAG: MATE family efflux transporter, partial [Firmicutes bacterium]|nr:MATE family efflux transporter [Bacillota bacterium]
MSTRRTADFTQGSIPRHLAQFSLPLLVGNVFQALYNAVDSMWVGRFLGPDALAAVSVGFPVIFALVSLVMGFAMAATVLVSQYSGAGRMDMVRRAAGNSLTMMVVSAVLVSILGVVFNREILGLINTPPEIIGLASGYLNVFFSGMIFMFIYNTAGGILRGLGDSKTPVIYLVYSTVINIVLDPILIFGFGPIPKMGVMGAAAATVIAQAVAAVLTVHYLRRGTKVIDWEPRSFKPDRELTLQTLRIGIPAGMQFTVVSFSALVVGAIVNAFGKTVVAGFGAASRVELFAFFPAMSFGIAVSSLAG